MVNKFFNKLKDNIILYKSQNLIYFTRFPSEKRDITSSHEKNNNNIAVPPNKSNKFNFFLLMTK